MKKEAMSSDDFNKPIMVKQDRKYHQNSQARCKVKTETMDEDLKSVDRVLKSEDCRFDEFSREYHLNELKKLLSSDLVMKMIKPKLTGSLRGPISAPKTTPNVLEAHRRQITF